VRLRVGAATNASVSILNLKSEPSVNLLLGHPSLQQNSPFRNSASKVASGIDKLLPGSSAMALSFDSYEDGLVFARSRDYSMWKLNKAVDMPAEDS
jgi:hypothetical protein